MVESERTILPLLYFKRHTRHNDVIYDIIYNIITLIVSAYYYNEIIFCDKDIYNAN